MLTAYSKQKGKRKLASIFVSSTLEAKMIAEASKRETEVGTDYSLMIMVTWFSVVVKLFN